MKIKTIFAQIAAITILGACTTSDVTQDSRTDETNTVGIAAVTRGGDPATSVSTEAMQQEFFLTNVTQRDKVGDKYEAAFEYANGTWTPDAKVMWYGSENNVFQAFTPVNTYDNKASYDTFYIPDQSRDSFEEKEADWMTAWAKAKRGENEGKLSLVFRHMLTKVTVKVPKTGTMDGKSFTVYEYGTRQIKSLFRHCQAQYNGDNFTLTLHPQGQPNDRWVSTKWVDAGTENGQAMMSMSAIIVPGDYSNTQFANDSVCRFDIQYEDNTTEQLATEFPSESRTLEPGSHYTYTVTSYSNHPTATISQVSVEPWTSETISSPQPADHIPYVTFSAVNEQGFTMDKTTNYSISGLQYCVGENGVWSDVTANTQISFGGDKGDLRLRGKNIFGTSNANAYSYIIFTNNVLVSCTGDIRTLLDYENYQNVNTKEARFERLFKGCTSLTSAPALPATVLADGCYSEMFTYCTSLTSAPVLPATKLANKCYYNMFNGCTSLTSAPELPADTLADNCYFGMFAKCTSLTSAPALPANNLANECYRDMFSGCSALKTAPALPATILAYNCYKSMFSDCSALTTAPALPATELADSCYFYMFNGCTSLTEAPELKAETLANCCYYQMFNGCKNLENVTMLAKDVNAEYCLFLWLGDDAGNDAPQRTLKLYDAAMYNTIKDKGTNWLPTLWQEGEGGATITYAQQQTTP